MYDPLTDAWEVKPSMPSKRGGIVGETLGNIVFVFGGESFTQAFNTVEGYDTVAKEWKQYKDMPTARHGLAAASVGDKIYVIGGGKRPGGSVSGKNEAFSLT